MTASHASCVIVVCPIQNPFVSTTLCCNAFALLELPITNSPKGHQTNVSLLDCDRDKSTRLPGRRCDEDSCVNLITLRSYLKPSPKYLLLNYESYSGLI